MDNIEQNNLEFWLSKKRKLQDEEIVRRQGMQSITLHMKQSNEAISQILLTQYGLGRGEQVIYNGTRLLVDGMTMLFGVHLIILAEHMDGYSPFDDFCLASPEAEKLSRRYTVKPESISEYVGKGNMEFWC